MVSAPTVVIGFDGAATVREADLIAGRLKQALASSDRIEIDCSGLDEIDISFLQLIISARNSAQAAGKQLVLSAPASGALLDAVTACYTDGASRPRIWTDGSACK